MLLTVFSSYKKQQQKGFGDPAIWRSPLVVVFNCFNMFYMFSESEKSYPARVSRVKVRQKAGQGQTESGSRSDNIKTCLDIF
jgi:hypothetical protein